MPEKTAPCYLILEKSRLAGTRSSSRAIRHLAHVLIRSIRDEQVYVVTRDLPGHNLQFALCGDLPQQVAHTNRYVSRQHRLPVFRNPHQMNLQVAFRVRAQSVMSHATTLHQACLA
jgi:hypothetical protein